MGGKLKKPPCSIVQKKIRKKWQAVSVESRVARRQFQLSRARGGGGGGGGCGGHGWQDHHLEEGPDVLNGMRDP